MEYSFEVFEVVNTRTNEVIRRYVGMGAKTDAKQELNKIENVYGPGKFEIRLEGKKIEYPYLTAELWGRQIIWK